MRGQAIIDNVLGIYVSNLGNDLVRVVSGCGLDNLRVQFPGGWRDLFAQEGIDTTRIDGRRPRFQGIRISVRREGLETGSVNRDYAWGIYKPSPEEIFLYGGPIDDFEPRRSVDEGHNFFLSAYLMENLAKSDREVGFYLSGEGRKHADSRYLIKLLK